MVDIVPIAIYVGGCGVNNGNDNKNVYQRYLENVNEIANKIDLDNIKKQVEELFNDIPDVMKYSKMEKIINEKFDVNITRRTVLYYIEEGLLPEGIRPKSDKKTNILYTKTHLYLYVLIAKYLREYLSIEKIKVFLKPYVLSFKFIEDKDDELNKFIMLWYSSLLFSETLNKLTLESLFDMKQIKAFSVMNSNSIDEGIFDVLLNYYINMMGVITNNYMAFRASLKCLEEALPSINRLENEVDYFWNSQNIESSKS